MKIMLNNSRVTFAITSEMPNFMAIMALHSFLPVSLRTVSSKMTFFMAAVALCFALVFTLPCKMPILSTLIAFRASVVA